MGMTRGPPFCQPFQETITLHPCTFWEGYQTRFSRLASLIMWECTASNRTIKPLIMETTSHPCTSSTHRLPQCASMCSRLEPSKTSCIINRTSLTAPSQGTLISKFWASTHWPPCIWGLWSLSSPLTWTPHNSCLSSLWQTVWSEITNSLAIKHPSSMQTQHG